MRAHLWRAIRPADFDALSAALDQAGTFAPASYRNWSSIAKDGADAARAQSLDAVKASCRSCHTQYRDRYQKEMRGRPVP
jgi:hypothetical protein